MHGHCGNLHKAPYLASTHNHLQKVSDSHVLKTMPRCTFQFLRLRQTKQSSQEAAPGGRSSLYSRSDVTLWLDKVLIYKLLHRCTHLEQARDVLGWHISLLGSSLRHGDTVGKCVKTNFHKN